MMLSGLVFASPWLLLALAGLPIIWWLLRVTPPAPRRQAFPAVRLLLGLTATEETPARTPWWLMALRLAAAACVILALAGPVLDAARGGVAASDGPMLLVIDNGWASATDWPARQRAAEAALDRAERDGRSAALLATAPAEDGSAPAIGPVMPAADLRVRLAAMRPLPWPVDRATAATALSRWKHAGTQAVYIADGLTDGTAWADFARALTEAEGAGGTLTRVADPLPPARLMLTPVAEADRLVARVAQTPRPQPTTFGVLARTGDDRTIARADATVPAGATTGEATIVLPPELRNQLARLVVEGQPTTGGTALLDERWRRRPVGLLAGGSKGTSADAPLTGSLFYVRRALSPYAEVREGDAAELLARPLSVLVVADRPFDNAAERDAITRWVQAGGLLVRFAGPNLADAASAGATVDTLLPERLLIGDRQLGGAMSWSQPAALASFPRGSPFAGLTVPSDVKISQQVLAEPSAELPRNTWASLTDGTPLVTSAARGAGRVVLVHVTANADWSNLPLSGLFVDMLRRMVMLSVGVTSGGDDRVLAPASLLDAYGQPAASPPAARGLAANRFASTVPSPEHPPGLYGPESDRRALDLGAATPPPVAAPPIAGAAEASLATAAPARALGPWLMTAAIAALIFDLLLSMLLRGLLPSRRAAARGATAALLALMLAAAATPLPAHATTDDRGDRAEQAALKTRLAYVVTGDPTTDEMSRAGLAGLTDSVDRRTAAVLTAPDGVTPGQDDLSVYPLLYWPIVANAAPLGTAGIDAMNAYMAHGGIVLIDTQGGAEGADGSGAGFAPEADQLLRNQTAGLLIPPLVPLTTDHVLARSFYLLQDYPGRFDGATVWVQRDQDRANDSVSPLILGQNNWAAAWATDANGNTMYATIPGGARQRVLAYRFGINLVMYALTGNYKGDQVHVPAILERLGQ